LPSIPGLIPTAVLAGALIRAGFKLLPVKALGPLWREHRGEAVVMSTLQNRADQHSARVVQPECSRASA
jgi:hypothetical protein